MAEEDVLSDREVFHQVSLLVDGGDSLRQGGRRVPSCNQLAVDADLARRRFDDSGDALDQGRLAGTVRADDAVHLTAPHVEVDAAQRTDAGVLLHQTADLEDGSRVHQATISGRSVCCAIFSPILTFSSEPPQTGSSCSTDKTPSNPPSYKVSTRRGQST